MTGPAPDEVEVSLFGPGAGECVVVHLGEGEWMVVDSCINSATGNPVALDYLSQIGVDPSQVVSIVATHWHDDHVRGLAATVAACEQARFFYSELLRRDEFQTLIEAGGQSLMTSSGTSELANVMEVLRGRKRRTGIAPRHFAGARQLVWERGSDQVRSLSPSDEAVVDALTRLAELIPEIGAPKRRIGDINANHASVVLWIKIDKAIILLGGDLERRRDRNMGWRAILDDPVPAPQQADVYKVAHHGSETADDPGIWSDLLSPEPIAVLTPFTKSGLPRPADVTRICALAGQGFISSAGTQGVVTRASPVQTMVDASVRYIKKLEPETGQVRLRAKSDRGDWSVHLVSPAAAMCP